MKPRSFDMRILAKCTPISDREERRDSEGVNRDNREEIASPEQRRRTQRLARVLKGGKDIQYFRVATRSKPLAN